MTHNKQRKTCFLHKKNKEKKKKKKQKWWLPGSSKGSGLQEKRRHQQVCRVLCNVVAEQLSTEPAFGQATCCAKTWVLLLEPSNKKTKVPD